MCVHPRLSELAGGPQGCLGPRRAQRAPGPSVPSRSLRGSTAVQDDVGRLIAATESRLLHLRLPRGSARENRHRRRPRRPTFEDPRPFTPYCAETAKSDARAGRFFGVPRAEGPKRAVPPLRDFSYKT